MKIKNIHIKANKAQRLHFANISKALNLVEQVLKNTHHERSSNRVAFDCRIYAWLDLIDVRRIIEERNFTHDQARRIKEEFTQEALDNMREDTLQNEASFFAHTWAAGKTTHSPGSIKILLDDCKREWPEYESGYTELDSKLKKAETRKKACECIRAFFKQDLIDHKKFAYIDPEEVYQFGRSGGWMSLAPAERFEVFQGDLDHALKYYFDTENKTLRLRNAANSPDWWLNISTDGDCSTERVFDIIAECEAILWALEEGRSLVKSFNKKYFLDHLNMEIDLFLSEIVINISAEQLEMWLNGEGIILTNRISYSYLRIYPKDTAKVQTSQGVLIPVQEAKKLYVKLQELVAAEDRSFIKGTVIGRFTIESFERDEKDLILTAGCHRIPWRHIQEFAHRFLLKEEL